MHSSLVHIQGAYSNCLVFYSGICSPAIYPECNDAGKVKGKKCKPHHFFSCINSSKKGGLCYSQGGYKIEAYLNWFLFNIPGIEGKWQKVKAIRLTVGNSCCTVRHSQCALNDVIYCFLSFSFSKLFLSTTRATWAYLQACTPCQLLQLNFPHFN